MKPVKDIQDIEYEIKKALKILKSLPTDGPKPIKSHWPAYLNKEIQKSAISKNKDYCSPLPEEIDDMDEVLEDWLKQIEYDERNLVFVRNLGYSWKTLTVKFNYSRSSLYSKYVHALYKILKYVLKKQQADIVEEK